jgi:hypothetical protein
MIYQKNISESEEKLSYLMENAYQYQLKIEEGRKKIESLAEVNKFERDKTELKSSVIELE